MLKKWKVIAPLGLAALGALAAGVATLMNRPKAEDAEGKAPPAAKASAPANTMAASYSFISGFKDAVTVEMSVRYDADKFSFAVVEDEFLCPSGDSHVAILWGEKLDIQFEYASYYAGEDFAALRASLAEKHKDLRSVRYGDKEGLLYVNGDNLCLALPIPEDPHSYLLVSLVKARDNDDELSALPDYPEVRDILGSIRFERR